MNWKLGFIVPLVFTPSSDQAKHHYMIFPGRNELRQVVCGVHLLPKDGDDAKSQLHEACGGRRLPGKERRRHLRGQPFLLSSHSAFAGSPLPLPPAGGVHVQNELVRVVSCHVVSCRVWSGREEAARKGKAPPLEWPALSPLQPLRFRGQPPPPPKGARGVQNEFDRLG